MMSLDATWLIRGARTLRRNRVLSACGLAIAAALLHDAVDVGREIGRCVMVTRPQPGGIERDLDVLRTINRDRGGKLSVGARVARPGLISEGDELIG